MNNKFLLIVLVSITTILSGCASTGSRNAGLTDTEQALCLIAMTAGGAGAGAVIDNEPEVFIPTAIIGAAIGYFVCDKGKTPVAMAPADGDGDGVTDNNDRCLATPRGTRVDAVGCALDSDGDGVTDNNDRCPTTPRGTAVNSLGCERDDDSDGVVNSKDECPATPRGQAVSDKGCHMIFSLEGVNFETNSANLTAAARGRLNEGVQMLKANANVNVNIEGYTDSRGSDTYNMDLSQRRAQAVLDFLSNNGINRSRMTAVGRGEGSPVASNETDAGRAQNRRVEITVRN